MFNFFFFFYFKLSRLLDYVLNAQKQTLMLKYCQCETECCVFAARQRALSSSLTVLFPSHRHNSFCERPSIVRESVTIHHNGKVLAIAPSRRMRNLFFAFDPSSPDDALQWEAAVPGIIGWSNPPPQFQPRILCGNDENNIVMVKNRINREIPRLPLVAEIKNVCSQTALKVS